MIKFIIEVSTSSRDVNGNCYHLATIIKTDTRESMTGLVGGASNPTGCLRDLGFDFEEIKFIESVIPIRQFNRLAKARPYIDLKEFADFTGVIVWHLTADGMATLCNIKSDNRISTAYSDRTLDSGVWCNNCRRLHYYRKVS